ncbi:MAG: ABC transporter substrate-binding protein [Acidimicrobiia bacterium]
MKNRSIHLGLALVLAGSMLAACGDDSDDDASSEEDASPSGPAEGSTTTSEAAEPEATTIRVTTLNLCSEHIHWGIEKGLFADAGLDVELLRTAGGAEGLAAIVGGSADISYTNTLSSLLAIQQGFPVQIVAGSTSATEGSHPVLVAADSDIESPADLSGTTVAIAELGGIGQYLVQRWIADDGGDDSTTSFVSLPRTELVDAVVSHKVDAVYVDPARAFKAQADGIGRVLGNPVYEATGASPASIYISTDEFVEENEDAMATWVEVMEQAAEQFADPANATERNAVMSAVCGQPAESIAASTPYEPEFDGFISMETLGKVYDVLVAEGALREGGVDLEASVAEFARE